MEIPAGFACPGRTGEEAWRLLTSWSGKCL